MHSLSMIIQLNNSLVIYVVFKILSGSPNYQYILYNSSYKQSSVDITLVTNRAQWILLQLQIELSGEFKKDNKQQRLIKVVSKQCLTSQKCLVSHVTCIRDISRLPDIYLETSLRKSNFQKFHQTKSFVGEKVL